MNEMKAGWIAFGFAMIPYLAVAWAYSFFTEGRWPAFWTAFGFLSAARIFFSIIETLGGVLAWRLFYRKQAVENYVQLFRANQFPPKEYYDDDFGNYSARLTTGHSQKPDAIKACQDLESILLMTERSGILRGMRIHAAVETAFERYMSTLPKSDKSRWGPH